jgi:hypothetical protein
MLNKRFIIALVLSVWAISWSNLAAQSYQNDSFFKYGFKLGYNIPMESDYSNILGKRTMSGEVGFWGRVGNQYAGEMGLEIYFNKRYFSGDNPSLSSMIETRYLQVPLRFRVEFPTFKEQKIHGAIGIIWQQLLQVSENNVGYSKKNVLKSPFVFTVGIGYSYKFITFELNYRHFLRNFDLDNTKNKQKYLNLSAIATF